MSFVSSPHQPHHHGAAQRYSKRNSYEYVFGRASTAPQCTKRHDVSRAAIPDDSPRPARPQHSATNTNANRRDFVVASARAAATIATGFALVDPDPALADPFTQRTGEQLYVLSGKRNKNSTSFLDISGIGDGRSVEECLLKLLPVQNRAYKSLQRQLVDAVAPIKSKSAEAAASPDATEVSIARSVDDKTWRNSLQSMTKALKYFNDQRSRLEPLFNENDTTEMTVMKDLSKPKTRLIDGQYAPFGYVTEGYDLLATLKPGDVIGSTDVSEFGYLNLIRVRGSTFGDIIQSSNDDKEKEEAGANNEEKE